MVTEQEVEDLKISAERPLPHLVQIQCTKSPDVVNRTAELLAEVENGLEVKRLKCQFKTCLLFIMLYLQYVKIC